MNTYLKPVGLSIVFCAAIALYFHGTSNSDFLAVYLAGLSYSNGQFDQVYPTLSPVFDLSYPDSWRALAQAQGVADSTKLYPFIYPPIWAVIASWGASLASFATISVLWPVVNAALLIGCSALAWRITRSSLPLTVWLSVGFLTMATTTYGYVALAQGQPQILTTFLILLAVERARADAPFTAGGCLALAASIKIYPLLFVVVWLARKDWRALAGFLGLGIVLAAASISLAGWPMHQAFAAQIAVISDSALVTPLSYNFTSILTAVTQDVFANPMPYSGSTAPMVLLVNKLALAATLLFAAFCAARVSADKLYSLLWPMLLIAVSFFSPMSWSYHFLTALAFAPLVFSCSRVTPKLFLFYMFVASSIGVALSISNDDIRDMVLFWAGISSVASLAASIWTARPDVADKS